MGIPLKNWLYFIGDGKGKTARMVNGVAQMLGGNPVPLQNNPSNWRELQLGFATDHKYRSLNRTATVPATFVGDGADILRWYKYQGKGYAENLYLIILQKSEVSGKYELEYSGLIDMPKAKDLPQIGVSVNAKQGGPIAFIAANESTMYSIDSTAANTDTFTTLFDGMTFKQKYNYIFGTDNGSPFSLTDDFNNSFPMVLGVSEGYAFDVVKNESVMPEAFSDIAEYVKGANYIFYRPYATEVTTGGQLIWCRTSSNVFHVDIYFYTSAGRRFDIALNQLLSGSAVAPTTTVIPTLNITLAADEKIFLFVTRAEGGDPSYGTEIFTGTEINFEVETINQPTTAQGFRPLPLWQELVNRISKGKCVGASNYFTTNTEISIFAGQSLRNLSAAVLQISFEQYYKFYDSLRPMGLKCVGNTIYIEPIEDIYGGSENIFDYGEVSKVSVSFAFDALANTAKYGYPGLNIQELNGVPEFNGTNLYSLPVDTLKAEVLQVSSVICAASEIEKTRCAASTLNANSTPADNTIFGANVSTVQDVDNNYLLTRKAYTSISGVVDSTVYNIEQLTPGRMVRAAGAVLSPMLEQQGNAVIKFESSDRTGALITTEPGLTIAERADISRGALTPGIWHALDLEFEAPVGPAFSETFSNLNKGLINVNYLGSDVKLLPIGEMSSKPATSEPQQARLRISALTPFSVLQSLSLQGIFSIDSLNNTIFISALNPIHLSRYGTNTNRYQSIYDNQFQQRGNVVPDGAPYPYRPAYLQKWVKTRSVPFQFVTSGYGLLTVKIFDARQNVLQSHDCTIVPEDAVLAPYILQQISFDLSALADGRYIFVVYDGATPKYISEWIDLRAEWPTCHEISYYHTTNKFNTYWTSFRPSIFVEATILPLQTEADGTEYIDELKDNETLDGRTWDVHTIMFGNRSSISGMPAGIPDWMKNKLNIILLLNRWATEDGTRWAKAENKNLVPIFPTNNALNVYTANISPAIAVTGLIDTGTPTPLTDSFAATMDASSFGIDGGGVIDIEVTNP